MHRDLKMSNVFVAQAHDLDLAELAVGDFGAAQEGLETVSFIRGKKTGAGTDAL